MLYSNVFQSEFNFAKIFSEGSCPREAKGRELLEKYTANKNFNVEDMFKILRDKDSGICMPLSGPPEVSATTSSQVSCLFCSNNNNHHHLLFLCIFLREDFP